MMETAFDPDDPNRTVAKEVCKPGRIAKEDSAGRTMSIADIGLLSGHNAVLRS
jgi:hypothetical protein